MTHGINVKGSEITLSPPTKGCNLVTLKVNNHYSLHIFTHASGRASVSIHPRDATGDAHIDIMGHAEMRKKSVRNPSVDNGGFDYFELNLSQWEGR